MKEDAWPPWQRTRSSSSRKTPYVGSVTTLRPDGSPHSTVVWVDVRDGAVGFNTARGRAKARHIERDPRVSLLVVDPNDAYKWVAVSGRAELTDEGADEQIDQAREEVHRPGEVSVA